MLQSRAVEVRLLDTWPPASVAVNGEHLDRLAGPAAEDQPGWWYDEQDLCICIRSRRRSVHEQLQFVVTRSLPMEADAPLREGLRAQLTLLEDIALILDAHTPRAINDALTIRTLASRDPERAVEAARALQRDWWSLVESVGSITHPARDNALAKLLGLITHLDVVASESGALTAVAEIDFAPRFLAQHPIAATASFSTTDAWRLGDTEKSPGATRTIGEQFALSARLAPGSDASCPATLTLSLTVEAGSIAFQLDTHRTFCPSVNSWAISGPYEAPFEDSQLDEAVFDESSFAPASPSLPTLAEPWRTASRADSPAHRKPHDEFTVDLQKVFVAPPDEPIEHAWCYAACTIESPDDRDALLVFGSDDSIRILLNAQQVFHHHIQRGYRPREERQAVRLRKGTNTLLLKIGNATLGWAFGLHIETPDAKPMTDLRYRLPAVD